MGKSVLNRNVQQLGFNPGWLISEIEPSSDRLLQGRVFTYKASANYRLGKNVNQIPGELSNESMSFKHCSAPQNL
jgi:catalase